MSYIPILFDETTTNYNNNGIAMLSDTLDYYVVEGRNDIFELTLEYPASGKWASELKDWRQILAKPNEKDDPHVFRITEIVKDLNPSTIYVYATSITNDLGGNLVVELNPKNLNGQEVMNALKANLLSDNRFNFISDIQTRSSTYWYMRNPLNCLVGGEGSFVQYWGGEVKRTNDTIYVYSRRGRDNVTVLRPDKNIEGFTITTSTKSVVTRILPYFSYYSNGENPQEVVVIGDIVASPLANNYPIQRIVPVDFTGDETIVDKASLMTKANTYFTTLYPDIDKPDVQIEIDMLQLSDSAFYSKFKGLEQINLTDTITVWIEKYNIDMEVKVVELTYNGMSGRTISLVAGAKAASLYETQKGEYSSQINNLQKYISTVENGIINIVQESADGKNRIFRGYTEPSPDISKPNDLWFKEIGNGEVEVYTFDGMTWQPMLFANLGAEIKAEVEEALQKSEEAKQVAEQSYADSVAEAERLVQVQTDAFNAQMTGVNQEISTVKSNIDTAIANVNQEIANNFTSLSDSISEVDDIATQAKSNAQTAKNDAQTALSNASTALGQAQTAVSTAASANNKAIKSSVVDWALSSSGTTPPTSGWQTSVPTPSSTQYTWGRTTITLNDGTTILSYNVSKIGVKGDKGDTGAGGAKGDKGDAGVNAPKIKSVKQQFYLSTSNTTQTGGSWTETIPVWSSGKYYWTRVVTTYDNATTTPSVAVLDNALNQSLVTALEAKSDTQTLSTTVSQHATQIAAKASQTTVDTLTGRVSTAEGSIEVQAGQIALKANQTTVDTLTGRVGTAETKISANTTAINLRATKSSVDTLTGRVTTAEGTITAQAGQIALRATTATVNALTGRVSTAEASIVAQSGRIDLAATKTELTTAIDGIEVGGRNLVVRTNELEGTQIVLDGSLGTGKGTATMSSYIDVTPGKTLTFTKTDSSKAPDGGFWRWRWFNGSGIYISRTANKSNNFQWVVPSDAYQIQVSYPMDAFPKLEKGNKATDWTPAPEDVDAAISTVQSNLTVEAGKITALTTRVSGSETNISNVTQTVSGINTTISTLRTDVNGKATIVALNQVKSTADGNKTTISNHAGRLTTVETNVNGLQTTVSNKAEQSQVTQMANSLTSVVTSLNGVSSGGKNLLTNGSFENWTSEYGFIGWGKYSSTSSSSVSHSGSNALYIGASSGYKAQQDIPVIPGNTYEIKAWVQTSSNANGTAPNQKLRIGNYDGGALLTDLGWNGAKTEWTELSKEWTVPAGVTMIRINITSNHTVGWVRWDDVSIIDITNEKATQSQFTQLSAQINLRVTKGDVVSQINIEAGRTLISSNKLLLDANTYIMGTTFANDVKAKSLEAITANITSIRSQVLVTDSVTSTHIKAENALIDSLFSTTALITRLTSKTAFINDIKAVELSASKITSGTLNATNVNIINLNVSKLVGDRTAFVKSAWDSVSSSVSITSEGLISNAANGAQALIQNGVLLVRGADKVTAGYIGFSQSGTNNNFNITVANGRSLQMRYSNADGTFTDLIGYYSYLDHIALNKETSIYGLLHMRGNSIINVNKVAVNMVDFNSTGAAIYPTGEFVDYTARTGHRFYLDTWQAFVLSRNRTNNTNYASMHAHLNMQGYNITGQSDRRLKTNITASNVQALNLIKGYKFVEFNWVSADKPRERQFGLIAQDTPFLSFQDTEGIWNINSSRQIMLNSLGLQEMDSKVTRIDTFVSQHDIEIDNLQKENESLRQRIELLEEKIA